MLLKDRYDAAIKLIPYLEKYINENSIVLAVPRGGVPIGFEIAKHYKLPLELLLTKKIGHPWSKELAIGAVSLEEYVIDESYDVFKSYIKTEIEQIRKSLNERYKKFMGNRNPIDLKDKTVIIVDDGVATGNTLLSAIKMIRQKQPEKIVVAVPVSALKTAEEIKLHVEDFICLYELDHFIGVSLYYFDFSEVSDEEVVKLLNEADRFKHLEKIETEVNEN